MTIATILTGIVCACLLIILFIYMYWQIKENGLNTFIIAMITKAEEEFNEGENEEKINFVIDRVIAILPGFLRLCLNRELVKNIVQDVFDKIKVALDYNKAGK